MKLKNEFEPIRQWAKDRGIYEKGDPKTQFIKLQEEMGELAQSILKNDNDEFIDAIGDCVVVLTNLAALKGIDIEQCINGAYDVIAKRTGKMENGTFVKDK
jgi:NTP pyrophosphatase (non-canonical NTP hydrolase)